MDEHPNPLMFDRLGPRGLENDLDDIGMKADHQVERTMQICLRIEKSNMTPKSFLSSFLTSSNPEIVTRRRLWVSQRGWPSTSKILDLVKNLSCKNIGSRRRWSSWIFDQAKEIVKREKGPGRRKGVYVNATKVTHELFERSDDGQEVDLLQKSTPFIYNLIHSKLDYSSKARKQLRESKKIKKKKEEARGREEPDEMRLTRKKRRLLTTQNLKTRNIQHEDDETLSSCSDTDSSSEDTDMSSDESSHSDSSTDQYKTSEDEEPNIGSGPIYRRSTDKDENDQQRNNAIASAATSMLVFGCNRRENAFQLEMSLTLLACGVSERINDYLHHIGLTSSRKTALRALETLGKETAKQTKLTMSKKTGFAPLMCVDNIDFEQRIHQKRLESASRVFHGSWGYIHVLKPNQLNDFGSSPFSSSQLKEIIRESRTKRIDISILYPTKEENEHWKLVLKSQIGHVLVKYIVEDFNRSDCTFLDPPNVQKIDSEKPDIIMLKMMKASDNSSEGVGELYEELIRQSGLTEEEFTERAQIIEGDLGTCINFASLKSLRAPSKYPHASLDHILMIQGAAHTLWNIGQAFVLAHWGDHLNTKDMGAWRGIYSLGGKKEKPTGKKDFTSMIRTMELLHEASICHCLLYVCSKTNT